MIILSHHSQRLFASAFFGLVLLGTSASAMAQADDWIKITEAAKKEGRVVVYTNTVPPVNEKLKAAFDAAYPGITMEYIRIVGPAIADKLLQEKQAGMDGGDVVITSEHLWLEKAAGDGLFLTPSGTAMKSWPKKYLIGGTVPVIGVEPFVVVYNTDVVKQPMTGYGDLLRPEFKGAKIGASELASPAVVAWYDWLEKTQGKGFLEKFAAQQPRLYVGATPATQAAASGEVAVAPFSIMSIGKPLIDNGAHIKVLVTNPSVGDDYGAGIVTWAHRPNAAQIFVNFLMSEKGQEILCARGEMGCPLPNIQGSLDADSITVFDQHYYTPAFSKAYVENWNNLFKPK